MAATSAPSRMTRRAAVALVAVVLIGLMPQAVDGRASRGDAAAAIAADAPPPKAETRSPRVRGRIDLRNVDKGPISHPGRALRTPRRATTVALRLPRTSLLPLRQCSRPRTEQRVRRSRSSARCPAETACTQTPRRRSPLGRTMSCGRIRSGSGCRIGRGARRSSTPSRRCSSSLRHSTLRKATCGMSRASDGGWPCPRASATSSPPETNLQSWDARLRGVRHGKSQRRVGGLLLRVPRMPRCPIRSSARHRTSSRSALPSAATPTLRPFAAELSQMGWTSRSTNGPT